jgi:hypothetical protein
MLMAFAVHVLLDRCVATPQADSLLNESYRIHYDRFYE